MPLSLIFYYTGISKPWFLLEILRSLRLLNLEPLIATFRYLKTFSLNMWRIFEVILYYYLICNYMAGVLLSMSAYEPDARQTWLRRIPVP